MGKGFIRGINWGEKKLMQLLPAHTHTSIQYIQCVLYISICEPGFKSREYKGKEKKKKKNLSLKNKRCNNEPSTTVVAKILTHASTWRSACMYCW